MRWILRLNAFYLTTTPYFLHSMGSNRFILYTDMLYIIKYMYNIVIFIYDTRPTIQIHLINFTDLTTNALSIISDTQHFPILFIYL